MKAIGASDWVVGLSFSLFALPLVLTAPIAGWASDRLDRRWLAVGSTGMTAILAPVYPVLHNIPAVIGVGAIEASAAAFGEPAMNTFLMSSVAPGERGRAVGTVGTADAASKAIGALIAGALFAVGIAVPFLVSSIVGIAFILFAVPSLRSAGRNFPSAAHAVTVAQHG
jgi:DHA1 family multidrug resistance protein-like MFS transporter